MQSTESKQSKLSENLSEKLVRIDNVAQQETTNEPISPKDREVVTKISVADGFTLTEDVFGQYWDQKGDCHNIKRFTWRNNNKIEVQVINYGARITSMKFPDRKGNIDDIVLGFDDLAGYIYYKRFYLGATIGRMSQVVKDSVFELGNKQYRLTSNYRDNQHRNGGSRGLDQVVWNTFTDGRKVVMNHMSPRMTEGYPGDVLVRITFELSERNEFTIDMEAITTETTIINLSNLTYFNLAGHHAGPDETYRHILTLNCNCFTPQKDGIPTGEIMNVVHSDFDFQVPKTLGKLMGITPRDGFDQNLCVNRGSSQGDCFVGRVLHPPSGRMLEIYSNQSGVNFSTANEFGYGRVMSVEEITTSTIAEEEKVQRNDNLSFLDTMRQKLLKILRKDEQQYYQDLRDFIMRLKISEEKPVEYMTPNNSPRVTMSDENLNIEDFIFKPLHVEYLKGFKAVLVQENDGPYVWLKTTIDKLLDYAIIQQSKRSSVSTENDTLIDEPATVNEEQNKKVEQKKTKKKKENFIPSYYQNTQQVVGKERKVYRMHSGIALQTQNYPNCANCKQFPSCVLKPGENYRHSITYKFWIRSGNPNKWIKRNMNECSQNTNK
ncbi:unnamed protein product [Phaedon cochleariae]|uniref:Galactose mutarotase n=1 Tax=Phaedon cochleariae TaxID=80249 RepID=A0A9P0DUC7_PHACE|nr:unnamed protein product [Phaedon cochleariae]